jgi:hypothetical protein
MHFFYFCFALLISQLFINEIFLNFYHFFGYSYRRDICGPPTKKSMLYLYSKCVFLRRNQNALYFVQALYFVRGIPSLGSKLGLADDFLPNFFSMTPPGNGTVGRGYKDLLENGFKVGENSPSAKIPCRRNFDKK